MMNKDCKRNKDDSKGKNAARNYATACSLIPVMYSQCGGALAYLAMSTTQVREQAEVSLTSDCSASRTLNNFYLLCLL